MQKQFAHEAGVALSTINQWEKGRERPQPFFLKRFLATYSHSGYDSCYAAPTGESFWHRRPSG
jgi:transcriptional regulator with XRE-family HTH domain